MNNEQNTYDNEYFISIIMLFILQLQQKEKTNKMLGELKAELNLLCSESRLSRNRS